MVRVHARILGGERIRERNQQGGMVKHRLKRCLCWGTGKGLPNWGIIASRSGGRAKWPQHKQIVLRGEGYEGGCENGGEKIRGVSLYLVKLSSVVQQKAKLMEEDRQKIGGGPRGELTDPHVGREKKAALGC